MSNDMVSVIKTHVYFFQNVNDVNAKEIVDYCSFSITYKIGKHMEVNLRHGCDEHNFDDILF